MINIASNIPVMLLVILMGVGERPFTARGSRKFGH